MARGRQQSTMDRDMRGYEGQPEVIYSSLEWSFSNNEALYSCTSCGCLSMLVMMWGFACLQWDDDISKDSERNVWLILGSIILLGACWSVMVVEPVVEVMQDDIKVIHGRQQKVGVCGQARMLCTCCFLIAIIGCGFGLMSNEIFNPDGEAEKGFEVAIWFGLLAIWAIFIGFFGIILASRIVGDDTEEANSDWRLRTISENPHSSRQGVDGMVSTQFRDLQQSAGPGAFAQMDTNGDGTVSAQEVDVFQGQQQPAQYGQFEPTQSGPQVM